MKLTKEEMMDAVTLGVKEFLHEICDSGDGYNGSIRGQEFFAAIEEGTKNAIWQVATNATGAPCADFYDSIKKGVENSMINVVVDGT